MSDELNLAQSQGVTLEALAKAPVWLAAGILGVPALIALGALWFVAKNVNDRMKALDQYGQSMLYMENQHTDTAKRDFGVILKFIDDDLRCQYVQCLNTAKTPQQQAACISPKDREIQYGIGVVSKPPVRRSKTGEVLPP